MSVPLQAQTSSQATPTAKQTLLTNGFFNRDACTVAQDLLGKIIRYKQDLHWLAVRIIETEAYYLTDNGSHASLGYTHKRRALFMPAGTIYMYYARGGDSLNISCRGEGNAVLIKAATPYFDALSPQTTLPIMQMNNPCNGRIRPVNKLCNGQTLLCRSLGLKVPSWDAKQFDPQCFYIEDVRQQPHQIIQTTRLGIPLGRDEHLPYRFIDYDFAKACSKNPLTQRQPPVFTLLKPGQ